MTYTKFEVKNRKNRARIHEHTLFIPELPKQQSTQTEYISENKVENLLNKESSDTNERVATGPEFLCAQSGFEHSVSLNSRNTFYPGALIISILFMVVFGLLLKYAIDNEILVPKPICKFFVQAAEVFESKSFSAFSENTDFFPDDRSLVEPNGDNEGYELIQNNSGQNDTPHGETSQPVSTAESSVFEDSGKAAYPIIKTDISKYGQSDIINETPYNPNLDELSDKAISVFSSRDNYSSNELPLVLIYHSHGTECYSPESDFYTQDTPTRSQNTDNNVVTIGQELKDVLTSFGINTIHCDTMHDKDNYNASYSNSYKTVSDYLEKYPSIKYTIDIHRDSIIKENKEKIRTWTEWGDGSAQIMLVVGTDASGSKHPNWQNNLSLASALQNRLNSLYPTFARPINLRKARFNQSLCDGALLLEVGSCGNTLDDAKSAIELFGPVYAKIILENETN